MSAIGDLLTSHFRWRGDRTDDRWSADVTGWWHDPTTLAALGPALAGLFSVSPTVVLGPQSRGMLLGALTAMHLGVGVVELRKEPRQACDSDTWRRRTTPPDYRDRHLVLGFRQDLVSVTDRVLFVDDWIDTGGQAVAARALVADAGATWIGAAVVVDALKNPQLRRELGVRSLVHVRDL
ncbi:MAG: phosphoribosyltransferase [Micrococcales bacterium]|nr:phosphoribosyltransferase [Micrococcales bacterium]